jgi:hypothetical protein
MSPAVLFVTSEKHNGTGLALFSIAIRHVGASALVESKIDHYP